VCQHHMQSAQDQKLPRIVPLLGVAIAPTRGSVQESCPPTTRHRPQRTATIPYHPDKIATRGVDHVAFQNP
jgi:hypothetical protein